MSEHQGSKQSSRLATPDTVLFTTEERIEFIAQLIVERIVEDQNNGFELLKKIEAHYGHPETT